MGIARAASAAFHIVFKGRILLRGVRRGFGRASAQAGAAEIREVAERAVAGVPGLRVEVRQRTGRTAIEAEPWAATPLLQRALVLEAAGRLGGAAADARAAADREPRNWRTWLTLARIEALRGRAGAALSAAAP